ncbi:hypothetical protein CTI12_AA576980 [Artemisia annua]|uniref:Uncharacterized protein n=1 Tax=Artemisia annua TaxID=35608 RepID=A0A2U1KQ61_ARTAN|nr:hypothetical protein CTI12_AA576980 [Artemisia annua]
MGSLMGGWDSHVHDHKSIHLERNKSMTRDAIETYWRSKKSIDEVHDALKPCHTFSKGDQKFETEKIYTRSNSLPITKESSILEAPENDDKNREEFFKKRGWWINSRWAFLNEPPVIASETPSRYASQFHVAKKHIDDI